MTETEKLFKLTQTILNEVKEGKAKAYYSLCSLDNLDWVLDQASKLRNLIVVFPSFLLDNIKLETFSVKYPQQCQISVYSFEECNKYIDIDKLYLIKNKETLEVFEKLIENRTDIKKIHFPILQSLGKETILRIVKKWLTNRDNTITLDSCLQNQLWNQNCIYETDHLDVNFDGTLRKCIFAKKGVSLDSLPFGNMHQLMNLKETRKCLYNSGGF